MAGRLMLDTSQTSYEVSTNPVPKMDDRTNQQKLENKTNIPMWTVKLYALSEGDGEVITVTVVNAAMPAVTVRQPVIPVDLEALPWVNERDGKVRHGVAFRCRDLRPVEAGLSAVA